MNIKETAILQCLIETIRSNRPSNVFNRVEFGTTKCYGQYTAFNIISKLWQYVIRPQMMTNQSLSMKKIDALHFLFA